VAATFLLASGGVFDFAGADSGRSIIYRAVNIHGKIVEFTSNICRAVNYTALFTGTARLPRRGGATKLHSAANFGNLPQICRRCDLPRSRISYS
jgi:hypothetical protein